MTGIGSSVTQTKDLELSIQIKTVNHRFFDVRWHMPKSYALVEEELAKIIKTKVKRGACDVYVQRRWTTTKASGAVVVDEPLADSWLKASRSLAKKMKVKDDLCLSHLLSAPDLIRFEENSGVNAVELKALKKGLKEAVVDMSSKRLQEGQFLVKTILKLLKQLEDSVKKISVLRQKYVHAAPTKLEERLKKLLGDRELDEQRLLQEVGHLVDKTDIEEEIQRLSKHLDVLKKGLTGGTLDGKKLDFYGQELLREINTMGSKSQQTEVTRLVIEGKSLVEQFREQVQNLE